MCEIERRREQKVVGRRQLQLEGVRGRGSLDGGFTGAEVHDARGLGSGCLTIAEIEDILPRSLQKDGSQRDRICDASRFDSSSPSY